jgi:hypothetical protein
MALMRKRINYKDEQDRILDQLEDRRQMEEEEIIGRRIRTGAGLTNEDHEKLRDTSVAGSTFLDRHKKK